MFDVVLEACKGVYAASDIVYLKFTGQLGVACMLLVLGMYLLAASSSLVVYVDKR